MALFLVIVGAWLALAGVLCVILCRAIRLADCGHEREERTDGPVPLAGLAGGHARRVLRSALARPDLDDLATWYGWGDRPPGTTPSGPPGRAPQSDAD